MLQDERDRLLALFVAREYWCQGAEARDVDGEAVRYDDSTAVAWDITGGMCLLFGWQRACALFRQVGGHILGEGDPRPARSPEIESMAALQDYNDRRDTTYKKIIEHLRTMPVRRQDAASG